MSDYMAGLRTFVETATGMSIADIQRETVTEARERVERKFGKPMTFTLYGKPITCQNAKAMGFVTRAQIEADLDRCLR